ncbi:hypothetical protein [Kitasatospora aureofaciens]|uniref:hypothetical protein n=1 Tax=Kitasatospora aureofaciens TaxID=1894 RepID=UPI001C449948|nr:hypothetical protein [Kitasatospora aureofaciens]MBV6697359.1 hypothetical protein [Kitasatospora aureofaciens]
MTDHRDHIQASRALLTRANQSHLSPERVVEMAEVEAYPALAAAIASLKDSPAPGPTPPADAR